MTPLTLATLAALAALRRRDRVPGALRFFVLVAMGGTCGSSLSACSRTALLSADLEPDPFADAGAKIVPSLDASVDALPDASITPGVCTPTGPESCNEIDDDCNGLVDDLPPIPCPTGGQRYCITGHYSGCPRRCESCFPGSEVICFISYCKYWGVQTCAADGRTLSGCKEGSPPDECLAIAKEHNESPELEQCCIDSGYCCADDFDLDHDGNKNEMIGRCDEVVCGP